jgi:hypothetical protein
LPRHRLIVARGFRVAGWILGLPCLALLVMLCIDLVGLHQDVAPDTSQPLDVQTYGLIALLSDAMRGLGAMFGVFGAVVGWLMVLLAVASLVLTLLAIAMVIAGRGIQKGAMWGRVVAILVCASFLVIWLAALAVLPGYWIAIPYVAIGILVYVFWVMIWRFD